MQARTYTVPERIPTLDELLAMPKAERSYWLRRAAELAAADYLENVELTATADAVDLHDESATKTG